MNDENEKSYRAYLVAFSRAVTGDHTQPDIEAKMHEVAGAALGARDGHRACAAGNSSAASDLGNLPMPRQAFETALNALLG